VNQGLQGAFNFADLTVDNIERIEVVRGPAEHHLRPPCAGRAIQIFTRRGSGAPTGSASVEGGSFGTLRGAVASQGSWREFDYSVGLSGLTTENERRNNEYRLESGIANVGWSPNEQLRIGSLFTYSLADIGLPNTITNPKPIDNFLTERWLIGPRSISRRSAGGRTSSSPPTTTSGNSTTRMKTSSSGRHARSSNASPLITKTICRRRSG
jgi:hypothetical protein